MGNWGLPLLLVSHMLLSGCFWPVPALAGVDTALSCHKSLIGINEAPCVK